MMRVVIDTNSLQTDELRTFLSGSRENKAVLPEHTTAEIFKPRTLDAVFAAHSVICDFPSQVIVLRANRHAMTIDARTPAIAKQFIDREMTRQFPTFCNALRAAEEGHHGYRQQLVDRQRWALERAQSIEDALGDQSDTLAVLRAQFSPEDLRRIGAGEKLSERSRHTILGVTKSVAEGLAAAFPPQASLPRPPYRYYHFGWRYALCHVIQLVRLMGDGAIRRAPAKARNDHFDNVFATFGTYFNGLMTNDIGPLATQGIARLILRSLGARLPMDYVESGYILELIDRAMRP